MALLHPTRWEELAPEFEAVELIERAIARLTPEDDPTTPDREDIVAAVPNAPGAAGALYHLDWARRVLHEQTRNPEARKEFAARRDGTYVEPEAVASRRRGQREQREQHEQQRQSDKTIETLSRQVAELTAALQQQQQPKGSSDTGAGAGAGSPPKPPSGSGGGTGGQDR